MNGKIFERYMDRGLGLFLMLLSLSPVVWGDVSKSVVDIVCPIFAGAGLIMFVYYDYLIGEKKK